MSNFIGIERRGAADPERIGNREVDGECIDYFIVIVILEYKHSAELFQFGFAVNGFFEGDSIDAWLLQVGR